MTLKNRLNSVLAALAMGWHVISGPKQAAPAADGGRSFVPSDMLLRRLAMRI
jgi:hypothetical protein